MTPVVSASAAIAAIAAAAAASDRHNTAPPPPMPHIHIHKPSLSATTTTTTKAATAAARRPPPPPTTTTPTTTADLICDAAAADDPEPEPPLSSSCRWDEFLNLGPESTVDAAPLCRAARRRSRPHRHNNHNHQHNQHHEHINTIARRATTTTRPHTPLLAPGDFDSAVHHEHDEYDIDDDIQDDDEQVSLFATPLPSTSPSVDGLSPSRRRTTFMTPRRDSKAAGLGLDDDDDDADCESEFRRSRRISRRGAGGGGGGEGDDVVADMMDGIVVTTASPLPVFDDGCPECCLMVMQQQQAGIGHSSFIDGPDPMLDVRADDMDCGVPEWKERDEMLCYYQTMLLEGKANRIPPQELALRPADIMPPLSHQELMRQRREGDVSTPVTLVKRKPGRPKKQPPPFAMQGTPYTPHNTPMMMTQPQQDASPVRLAPDSHDQTQTIRRNSIPLTGIIMHTPIPDTIPDIILDDLALSDTDAGYSVPTAASSTAAAAAPAAECPPRASTQSLSKHFTCDDLAFDKLSLLDFGFPMELNDITARMQQQQQQQQKNPGRRQNTSSRRAVQSSEEEEEEEEIFINIMECDDDEEEEEDTKPQPQQQQQQQLPHTVPRQSLQYHQPTRPSLLPPSPPPKLQTGVRSQSVCVASVRRQLLAAAESPSHVSSSSSTSILTPPLSSDGPTTPSKPSPSKTTTSFSPVPKSVNLSTPSLRATSTTTATTTTLSTQKSRAVNKRPTTTTTTVRQPRSRSPELPSSYDVSASNNNTTTATLGGQPKRLRLMTPPPTHTTSSATSAAATSAVAAARAPPPLPATKQQDQIVVAVDTDEAIPLSPPSSPQQFAEQQSPVATSSSSSSDPEFEVVLSSSDNDDCGASETSPTPHPTTRSRAAAAATATTTTPRMRLRSSTTAFVCRDCGREFSRAVEIGRHVTATHGHPVSASRVAVTTTRRSSRLSVASMDVQ